MHEATSENDIRPTSSVELYLLGYLCMYFDGLQGILHSALHGEFWRLIDPQGKPPGVMGWWPSRAVTFLENHDTGSTQVCAIYFLPVTGITGMLPPALHI